MIMNKIKILLADDHPLIREGFKALLGKSDRIEIVAEAENGAELIELAKVLLPDIILTDIGMPLVNGLSAIEKICQAYPSMKFIVLTMHEERAYILNALKMGVQGYVLKDIERLDLEKAIITIHEGGKYFSPLVTSILAESAVKTEQSDVTEISPREKEVLVLVSKGQSTKQIADQLGISIRTVESHRVNMLKKLKAANTAELVKKAMELQILD
jgi:DNA-binding NarL/FixJ family response regulator